MLWGPPSTGISFRFATRSGSRFAVDSNGRIRSSVPCTTSTGTSIFGRSAEVGQPGVDARIAGVRRGPGGDVEAGPPRLLADPVRCELVDVVEIVEEVLEVGVAVLDDRGLDALEHLTVDALGIVVGLEQERRNRAE